jgi:hypothetical protein
MNAPDVPGGVSDLSILLQPQWRHACQSSAEVKQNGGKSEGAALPFWLCREVTPGVKDKERKSDEAART